MGGENLFESHFPLGRLLKAMNQQGRHATRVAIA